MNYRSIYHEGRNTSQRDELEGQPTPGQQPTILPRRLHVREFIPSLASLALLVCSSRDIDPSYKALTSYFQESALKRKASESSHSR